MDGVKDENTFYSILSSIKMVKVYVVCEKNGEGLAIESSP